MSEEYDEGQMADDGAGGGPGAPTPLTALEVTMRPLQQEMFCMHESNGHFS